MDQKGTRADRKRIVSQGEGTSLGFLALFDSLSCPIILLDRSGAVQGMTGAARRLLGPDLMVRRERLRASDRSCDELLQGLIQACLADAEPSTRSFLPPALIRQKEKRPVVIQALSAAEFPGLTSETGAILVLTGLDAMPELPGPRLKLLFGLTRSEARLAARLATGETLEKAAEALQISLGTARNQLKAIFAKTGTCRQAELVALLWRASHLAVNAPDRDETSPISS